ncbi:energy-coupled thiamine transporter ThiT [Caldanaerobius polysaccharolyticus]|uniref:energy-coupled thiamine transporter ThiT n=1 Tax=Caldanaerobius polysaccharolyticus TaxID=44256 RepID=UPI000478DF23|nr:energy-coupled thiamine transporter ThiT [Caldanaerobius polysaccharolyticus]
MKYLVGVFSDFAKIKAITIAALVVVLVVVLIFYVRGKKRRYDTRTIVYGGLSIAISFVLSYVRLYHMPQGGTITPASMLPLFIYAYAFGPAAGITAGVAYGFLQLIQDAFVVHWAQLLLDYPLAFGALGIAGFFKKNLPLGIVAGGVGRFVFHFISGFVFFASYAPKGMNPVYYSLVYNATVIGPELVICLVVYAIPQVKRAIKVLSNPSAL